MCSGPRLVRRSVEKRCEIADDPDVGFCDAMGISQVAGVLPAFFGEVGFIEAA
jgi:hypothetical protein